MHAVPTSQNLSIDDASEDSSSDDSLPYMFRGADITELVTEAAAAALPNATEAEDLTQYPAFLQNPPAPFEEHVPARIPEHISRHVATLPPLDLDRLGDLLPTPDVKVVRARREVQIQQHMPAVLAASAAFQNAAGINNSEEWPVPPLPDARLNQLLARKKGGKLDTAGGILRASLRKCQSYGVSRTRWSGLGGLLDGDMKMLVLESEEHGTFYGNVPLNGQLVKIDELINKEKNEEGNIVMEDVVAKESIAKANVEGAEAANVTASHNPEEGISQKSTTQVLSHDDTGTKGVLTPQPGMSAARIVEVTDEMSTGCSEYLAPGEDSDPGGSSEMTAAESGASTKETFTKNTTETLGAGVKGEVVVGKEGHMIGETDDIDSVSSTEDNPNGEGSSSSAFKTGIGKSMTYMASGHGTAAGNVDVAMTDVDYASQDNPTAPGISVTSPGESSTAVQPSTTQLSKSQKKNQARKKKGYKKSKPKKSKTSSDKPTLPFDLMNRETHPPHIFTPTPEMMPGTFTNAICHHDTFMANPILTLTFKNTTPSLKHPDSLRNQIIAHFEVGLDGVEAIIQGQVSIKETSEWKTNVREKRVGKLGQRKEGDIGFDKELCKKQLEAGHGRGIWIFFAIRWRRTVEDARDGMGGKWVCFGAPVEALKRRWGEYERVDLNLFVDETKKRYGLFQRVDIKFSAGGIPCFDLMYGAEDNWYYGVWDKVKNAMANSGCVVSFLHEPNKMGVKPKDFPHWGILRKPDVGPFFSEGETKEIPGLLPGFQSRGDRGPGLAEQGGDGAGAMIGKGKGKAASVEDIDEEGALGGAGGGKKGKKGKKMPPPPRPKRGTSGEQEAHEWDSAKAFLAESQKKQHAEEEMEALCARLEKEERERYEAAVEEGRFE